MSEYAPYILEKCEKGSTYTVGSLDDVTPSILFHIPHSAVDRERLYAFMECLQIPHAEWPEHFETFCHTNGDQGAGEYAKRLAEMVTSREYMASLVEAGLLEECLLDAARALADELVIVGLFGNCHRSVLDLNRGFSYAPNEIKMMLTAAMPAWIQERFPGSMERARAVHQAAMAIEDALYPQVCQAGAFGVLNLHTYMPFNPQVRAVSTLYEDMYRIYADAEEYARHKNKHPRPDIECLTATREGELLAPADLTGLFFEKLQLMGYHDIALNRPFYHVEAAMCTQRAMKHRGWVTVLEVARDLFLDDRVDYRTQIVEQGVVTISEEQVEKMSAGMAAAMVSWMLKRKKEAK